MKPEKEILSMISSRIGAENAISIQEILNRLGTLESKKRDERFVKAVVHDARRRGVKIGSARGSKENPAGYYMIETSDELAATVRPLVRQAVDQLRTVEALQVPREFARAQHAAGDGIEVRSARCEV